MQSLIRNFLIYALNIPPNKKNPLKAVGDIRKPFAASTSKLFGTHQQPPKP